MPIGIGLNICNSCAPMHAAGGVSPHTAGPNSPATVFDDTTVGTISWTNPENAGASDDAYAVSGTVTPGDPQTHYLFATDFGFSIPDGSAINGILVEVECKASLQGRLWDARLVKGGTIAGAAPDTTPLPQTISGTESYRALGSDTDLWGNEISPDEVNDSRFGVAITFRRTTLSTSFSVDHIRMTVYYTP